MCEYCEGNEPCPIILAKMSSGMEEVKAYLGFRFGDPFLFVETCCDCDTVRANPINYCPMCGRDLREGGLGGD